MSDAEDRDGAADGSATEPFALSSDRPIESAEYDRLGRAAFARAIAQQILDAPSDESYVVAIMGPWGSGKTSLLNMLAEGARNGDATVVRFNPWIFAGTERLVGSFFREIGTQLAELKTDRFAEIGGALEKYAGIFAPAVPFIPVVG